MIGGKAHCTARSQFSVAPRAVNISEYEATSRPRKRHLYLEFNLDILWAYYMDIYLCVCKRISLDDQYLWGFFAIENWNLAEKSSPKTGKNLLKL